jgi:hypothetical protein
MPMNAAAPEAAPALAKNRRRLTLSIVGAPFQTVVVSAEQSLGTVT